MPPNARRGYLKPLGTSEGGSMSTTAGYGVDRRHEGSPDAATCALPGSGSMFAVATLIIYGLAAYGGARLRAFR
jgi:hypothetical protein